MLMWAGRTVTTLACLGILWLRVLSPPRPDMRGDDFFGDWSLIRPKAWDELTRRGEKPRIRRESID